MKTTLKAALRAITAISLILALLPCAHATPKEIPPEELALQNVLTARSNLLLAGYAQEDLDILLANLSAEALIRLSAQPRIPRLTEFVSLDYFHEDRLDRYAAYAALHPDYSPEDIVTYVNIGLDHTRYTYYDQIANPYALDVLVNQYHFLGKNFAPELVRMSSGYALSNNDYLHPEAYQWFVRMADAARSEGLTLRSTSAYRSYATQDALYTRYVNRDGVASADRYSARPGFSEHQTGLALDINVAGTRYHFEDSSEYHWLIENCWDYGFILRYPEDATHITGYIYEPWHYRYVGIELAQQLRASGLTYDEHLARQPVEKSGILSPLAFTVDGSPASFSSLICIDGTTYLSVNEMVDTLGWSCRWLGEKLNITAPRRQFSIPAPRAVPVHPYVIHGEQLYMAFSDLVKSLYLSTWQDGNTILISSVQPVAGWPFTDLLPYSEWYEAVCFVWQKGLFSGTGTSTFSPELTMTRGMAVTVLQKLDQKNTPAQTATFPDVSTDAWYAAGVSWACSTGVVKGYPDGLFRPDQPLTRQEAAQIMYAFSQHMDRVVSYSILPETVTDADRVADWAQPAVSWAYGNDLLLPREDGMLAPEDFITRAEMAHAMMLLCQTVL